MEEQADLTGADICSAVGYNSWGLVWLFQDFENAKVGDVPELLSDYPNNQHRVDALKQHFHKEPSVFGKFNSDQASAKPFSVSKDTPVVFLR